MRQAMILLVVLCSLYIIISGTSAETVIVDDYLGSWADYYSIQEAIDNSEADDVIRIYSGEFKESVKINRSISLIGNGTETLITSYAKSMVQVNADGVLLENLTIGNTTNNATGVRVNGMNLTIRRCHITRIPVGVLFDYYGNAIISECRFYKISDTAIRYDSGGDGIGDIESERIFECIFNEVYIGVRSIYWGPLHIMDCNFYNISRTGIRLGSGIGGTIEGCSFVGDDSGNGTGVQIFYRPYPPIWNCSFSYLLHGIFLDHTYELCEISDNTFFNNDCGIGIIQNCDVDIYSCLFYDNHGIAFGNILGGTIRVWNSTFIDNGGKYQYGANDYEHYKYRNETSSGNYWSDFDGTDNDNDGYGEGDYGIPSPMTTPYTNGTWYPPHHPRTFPFHTCSTSERDISMINGGNALIDLPLEGSEFTFYVVLECRNDTAFTVPIAVFGKDGAEWELLDAVITFNGSVIDGTIPQITSNSVTNETQYLEITIDIPHDSIIAIVINQFSRAVDQNGSFYWESDYENNMLVIEFEVVDKSSSNSATSIPDLGYVVLSFLVTALMSFRKNH